MRSRPFLLALSAVVGGVISLSGCQSFLDNKYAASVLPKQGLERITGITGSVNIRRNELGMPLIESNSFHDAIFAMGYVHAGDRLSQMLGMRALAQGRLAESHGPGLLDVDRFMRTVNLRQQAQTLYRNASPRVQKLFEVYARGVNAYLFRYRDRLPMDVAATGKHPEYWKAEDSALLFSLMNFSLAVNLQEELGALLLQQKVGSDKLPWLIPTYPDEPLPSFEAEKLKGLALSGQIPGLAQLGQTTQQIAELNMLGVAASNNWAINPSHSRNGRSLFANDTHLPLALPSAWNFVHIRSNKYQAAGVSIAGIPAVVAGYNGHLAWGMTMVMGDNQDLFLERLKTQNNRLHYEANGQWLAVRERQETFFIKGQRPIRESVYETRNGPLLNASLQKPSAATPHALHSRYGLALKMPSLDGDMSLDALFDLSRAKNVEQAFETSREIRAIPLNMVFADAQHTGWQVTGRYPNRRGGLGLLPSPGWNDDYQWDGYADPMLHPYDQDPAQGWLGTANQRTVPHGYGMQLSNSWYAPERAERIAQLASSGRHDIRSIQRMQLDQTTTFAAKLQNMLQSPGMQQPLAQAIQALPSAERHKAEEAYKRLIAFDGNMAPSSSDAAIYSAFLHENARHTFLDELGENSPSWQALVAIANDSYSAQADHLLGREDSPFWDDIRTPIKEDKPAILARSLAAAISLLENRLGAQRSAWQWGRLHTYQWQTQASLMAPYLDASERSKVNAIKGYLDRGPYAAGGDHSTLNVSAYTWGENFDTWLIPAMRITVDFSLAEPMQAINSSGQSGNPASPHYADGIEAWRRGQYVSFPFQPQNMDKVYGNQRLTLIPAAR